MTLIFPNPSRSLDAKRGLIEFWGYDGAIEISFFAETSILQKLGLAPGGSDLGILKAFDTARQKIEEIAVSVYRRDRRRSSSYFLAENDV